MMHASGQTLTRGEHRRADRMRSSITVLIEYQGRQIEGRLFDISKTGVGVQMKQAFFAPEGSQVTVRSPEFGALPGIVRWRKDARIGVHFGPSSNTAAKVDSYLRDHVPKSAQKRL
jgi:hypothetical protein